MTKSTKQKSLRPENSFLIFRFVYISGMTFFQIAIPILFINEFNIAEYGKWVISLSVVTFVNFIDFGFLNSVINKALKANAQKEFDLSKQLLSNLVFMIFNACFIVLAIALVFHYFSKFSLYPQIEDYIYCLVAATCVQVVIRTVEGIFRANVSSEGFLILVISYLFESTLILFGLNHKFNFLGLALLLLGSRLFFCIYGLVRIKNFISFRSLFRMRISQNILFLRENLSAGLHFLFLPIGYMILFDGTNIILGIFISEEFVAAVSLLRIATGIFRQLTSAVLTSFYPSLSQVIFGGNLKELSRLHKKMGKLLLIFTSLLAFAFLISLDLIMSKFLSESSMVTKSVCIFFLFTVMIDIPWNFRASFLFASNSHIKLAKYFLLSSIVAILIVYPLASNLNLYGVGIAFCVQDLMLTRMAFKKSALILQGCREVT